MAGLDSCWRRWPTSIWTQLSHRCRTKSKGGSNMPQQHEMFELPKLSLTVPGGLKEPRLWVRRLVIWEAPGGKIVRDIGLRPGLNIIWSPDGVDEEGAVASARPIGHGSGKTLFCRLLRYCLGEQRFADETQRESIAIALPNGIV